MHVGSVILFLEACDKSHFRNVWFTKQLTLEFII